MLHLVLRMTNADDFRILNTLGEMDKISILHVYDRDIHVDISVNGPFYLGLSSIEDGISESIVELSVDADAVEVALCVATGTEP